MIMVEAHLASSLNIVSEWVALIERMHVRHSQSEKENVIFMCSLLTHTQGENIQKQVVTIHANVRHNRLGQKEVKKSEWRKLSPVSPNSLALQNIQRCQAQNIHIDRSPLVVVYMSAQLQACAMHYVKPHTYLVQFVIVKQSHWM